MRRLLLAALLAAACGCDTSVAPYFPEIPPAPPPPPPPPPGHAPRTGSWPARTPCVSPGVGRNTVSRRSVRSLPGRSGRGVSRISWRSGTTLRRGSGLPAHRITKPGTWFPYRTVYRKASRRGCSGTVKWHEREGILVELRASDGPIEDGERTVGGFVPQRRAYWVRRLWRRILVPEVVHEWSFTRLGFKHPNPNDRVQSHRAP